MDLGNAQLCQMDPVSTGSIHDHGECRLVGGRAESWYFGCFFLLMVQLTNQGKSLLGDKGGTETHLLKSEPGKGSPEFGWLLAAAILSCVLQLFWFASKCIHQIDFDGMAYTGIARHLREGQFYSAINAFRSPLVSWLLAAGAFATTDYLRIGKLVSISTFLLCFALLYVFALQLWHSRPVAALAVLLFSLGRGLAVIPVAMVTPDFLFAACVLLYFMVLLRCVRTGSLKSWFLLGVVHGLAFLAKAFALPWLGLCTAAAVLLTDKPWRTKAVYVGLAAIIPLIVAAGWATVLHSKYGVYTTGSQFKTNLLQWTLHAYPEHRDKTYGLLRDTTKDLDEYVVADPMPPGSWAWSYHVPRGQLIPKLMLAEEHNVPKALKELTIIVTPGVVVAFFAMLLIVARNREFYPVEWPLAATIAVSALSLVLAYSMLVFDGRYLYPLIPLLLAVGSRFLIPDERASHKGWRRVSIVLIVLGAIASLIGPASPFRVLKRDFQASSYEAGAMLRQGTQRVSLVSIGSGPFPEYGVGWEAGYQAAYFGGARLIATAESLPAPTQLDTLMADLRKADPSVIMVWGRPSDSSYSGLLDRLVLQFPHSRVEKIADPVLGEVGFALFAAG
jgi:hypothetical protein